MVCNIVSSAVIWGLWKLHNLLCFQVVPRMGMKKVFTRSWAGCSGAGCRCSSQRSRKSWSSLLWWWKSRTAQHPGSNGGWIHQDRFNLLGIWRTQAMWWCFHVIGPSFSLCCSVVIILEFVSPVRYGFLACWSAGLDLLHSSTFAELGCCRFMVIKRGKPFIQKKYLKRCEFQTYIWDSRCL
jgi:hypothetical protein